MSKILLISIYLGELKQYINFFLNSLKNCLKYDFILLTNDDNVYKYQIPNNLKIIFINISCFNKLVFETMNLSYDFNIKTYKLCDFKPWYGIILNEHTSKYDYWGHCDLDIIFGNIDLIYDDIFNYDVYTFDDGYGRLYGPLTIYKNSTNINKLLIDKKSEIKDLLEHSNIYIIDEIMIFEDLSNNNLKIFKNKKHLTSKNVKNNIIKFENNKIYMNNYEYYILHYSKYKNLFNINSFILNNNELSKFYIKKRKIFVDNIGIK